MTTLDTYNDAIVSVKDKVKDEDMTHFPRKVLKIAHMYSNTKVPTARFELNGALITRNNNLVVGYKCLRCDVINEITLNLYMRKVNKNIIGCDACKNAEESKRLTQSSFMTSKYSSASSKDKVEKVKWSDKSLSDRITESQACFESEDNDFKTKYLNIHLTVDDFERVKSKIVSIGNGKLKDLTGWIYIPYYKIGNQTKYTPMIYNHTSNALMKPSYIEWVCECCESKFVNRDMEKQKNRIKIICPDCSFSNVTFKVKSMKTPWGKILYQSQYEKRFIDWCVENNVEIQNGPSIGYTWNEIQHKYRVDFQLPTYNKLIELKDNHIWHKMQIDSGKWGAKETIARKMV